jgi:hypothetical protein
MLSICVISIDSYAAIFSDDFESGSLNQWTIEGRRTGRPSTAEIVIRHNSKMAHLYQNGLTEVFMSKTFNYQGSLHFSFDMEIQIHSDAPLDSAYYADAGVNFLFLDNQYNRLGRVGYGSTTSSYDLSINNPLPNTEIILVDGAFHTFSLDVTNILSNITIDQNVLACVTMQFGCYTSGDIYSMYAHNWIDNVMVTPEPATLLLWGIGGLILRRKK